MFDLIIDLLEGLFGPVIDSFKKLKKYKKTLKVIVAVLLFLSVCFSLFVKKIQRKEVDLRIKLVKVALRLFLSIRLSVTA
jgi:hypothetical protein